MPTYNSNLGYSNSCTGNHKFDVILGPFKMAKESIKNKTTFICLWLWDLANRADYCNSLSNLHDLY